VLLWGSDLVLGLPYILSVSLAYSGSTLFHFLANRHFTFSAINGYPSVQMFRYLIMWCINYLITILVVGVCFELFHLSPYMGVCVAVLLTMCVGYFLSRYWVFGSKGDVV
jgi:putative flippase GtrA